jgi:hypothetical protein
MPDEREQAQTYRSLVLRYEEIGNQIQALIDKHNGHSENMSPEDMGVYRQLAEQRDELYNQIKDIEASWLDDSTPS